jgi:hypothetical protein
MQRPQPGQQYIIYSSQYSTQPQYIQQPQYVDQVQQVQQEYVVQQAPPGGNYVISQQQGFGKKMLNKFTPSAFSTKPPVKGWVGTGAPQQGVVYQQAAFYQQPPQHTPSPGTPQQGIYQQTPSPGTPQQGAYQQTPPLYAPSPGASSKDAAAYQPQPDTPPRDAQPGLF